MTKKTKIGDATVYKTPCPRCSEEELSVPVWEDGRSPLSRDEPASAEGSSETASGRVSCGSCGAEFDPGELEPVTRLALEVEDEMRRLPPSAFFLSEIIIRLRKEENLEMLEGLRDVIAEMNRDPEWEPRSSFLEPSD